MPEQRGEPCLCKRDGWGSWPLLIPVSLSCTRTSTSSRPGPASHRITVLVRLVHDHNTRADVAVHQLFLVQERDGFKQLLHDAHQPALKATTQVWNHTRPEHRQLDARMLPQKIVPVRTLVPVRYRLVSLTFTFLEDRLY